MIGLFGNIVDAFLRWMDTDDYDTDGSCIPEEDLPICEESRKAERNRMECVHKYYLTKDKKHDVEFVFMHMGLSGWRAYIITDIDYKKRKDNFSEQHRLVDYDEDHWVSCACCADNFDIDEELNYICWTENVYSLDKMMAIAAAWCEITFYYIRYGGEFPEIQKKLAERGII